MDFISMSEDERFQRANRECQVALPLPPNDGPWRHFFLSLYMQVIYSEEEQKRRYKDKAWDFCVIHSSHDSDFLAARQFIRLLETNLGIHGKSIGDVALGENTLEAASTMVQGSSKVFVLVSNHFQHAMVPKFVFQESLMQQLQRPDWRCKIIPMYLPGPPVSPPFFMANIQGFKLGIDTRTVKLVNDAISLEEQMQVRAVRSRDQIAFEARLKRLRKQQVQGIRDVIAGLRMEYGDDYDPSYQLQFNIQQLTSMAQEMSDDMMGGGGIQHINMSGCRDVSNGPSFHFYGNQADRSAPSDYSRSSSSSATSPGTDSSVYFNPESLSSATLSTLVSSEYTDKLGDSFKK